MGKYDKTLYFTIVDKEKFKKSLYSFGEKIYKENNLDYKGKGLQDDIFFELSLKLGNEPETIKKYYLSGHFSRKCIRNIINAYDKNNFNYTLEDIGVEIITNDDSKDIKNIIGKRLTECIKKRNYTQADFAKLTSFNESVVSKWCNGETLPQYDNLLKIALVLSINTDYLLGLSNSEKLDIEMMKLETGLSEEIIKIFQEYNKKNMKNNRVRELKNVLDFSYEGIIEFISNNEQFIDIFYTEAYKVLEYYCNGNCYEEYDKIINRKVDFVVDKSEFPNSFDLDVDVNEFIGQPYEICIETISKAVLHKKIDMMFDDFIDMIISKEGMSDIRRKRLLQKKDTLNNEIKIIDNLLDEKNN